MYPSTTALYPATVINNTAYCRNEDDILVVEFDGDEGVNMMSTWFCVFLTCYILVFTLQLHS